MLHYIQESGVASSEGKRFQLEESGELQGGGNYVEMFRYKKLKTSGDICVGRVFIISMIVL